MKRAINTLFALALLLGPVGCTSLQFGKTLDAINQPIQTGMKGYADAVVQGAVKQETQNKVRSAYDEYYAAYQASVDAAILLYDLENLDLSGADLEKAAAQRARVTTEVARLATTITNLLHPWIH